MGVNRNGSQQTWESTDKSELGVKGRKSQQPQLRMKAAEEILRRKTALYAQIWSPKMTDTTKERKQQEKNKITFQFR